MFKKVLIPVDLNVAGDAQRLLSRAKPLVEPWGSELHVVTVIPHVGMAIVGSYFDENFESESRKEAARQLAAEVTAAGFEAQQDVLTGKIYDCVIAKANAIDADLIIIGAHQPELREYLLGSNAARVVRHSKQSVLVVRGD
ncbi:universal stress protein [Roseovarius phycicola]|uniref:Universal stress protein n=1 Tax=Roseovarius phycicola TaxID=3080976 RepID=A0ABZ2HMT2_9RHOB